MIESIRIKNFRGIQTGQIDRFRKFNLLVGPNNSGKSAVLEALYLACTANRKALLLTGADESYDVRITENDFLGDDPMTKVWARHNYAERQARLSQDGVAVSLASQLAPLQNFRLNANRISEGEEPNVFLFKLAGLERGDNSQSLDRNHQPSVFDFSRRLFGEEDGSIFTTRVYCWSRDLTYNQVGFASWILSGEFPPAQHTLFFDVFLTLGHLPADFFRQMISTVPGWTQKIARSFGRIFAVNKVFNVQFFPADQEQKWMQGWIAPEDQVALTIDSYGDGARSVFKVFTPLLALCELVSEDAPGLFIWEEPELFQNPQTLNRLLAEVATLMKDKPIQLFIATHSLEVVANFVRLVREGEIAEDEMAAIRLNLGDGKLSSSVFDHRDIQDWTEMNLDLRVPSGKVDSPLTYQLRETVNATSHD